MGIIATSITGVISDCVSLMSEHAAPMAMKSEPYMRMPSVW